MWYRFAQAKADKGKPAKTVLHIYDTIGADMFFGGVDAGELVSEVEKLDADAELEVRINSPGGSAWDGLTIAHALMRHPGPTRTYVDGLAASAASVVALAGDEVTMSKYGQMMLHNARGGVYGTAEDLADGAKVLNQLNASMADYYADRAPGGGDAAGWARAMKRETWYNADEAKDAGLATAIDDTAKREEVEAAALASITKAAALFKYAGRQAAPAPTAALAEDGPTGPDNTGGTMPISEKVAERLGLATDASDDDVLAKLAELDKSGDADGDKGGDKAPDADKAPEGEPASEGEVAAVKAAAAKLGLTVTDPEVLDELRANSTLGVAAHTELTNRRITASLDDAIDKGKILPASRAKYEALMRKDEAGVVALLADIPNEAAAPMREVGHSTDPQFNADDVTTDPRYQAWKF
jgi:ATP-dependent protease ClpP protease subunit